MLCHDACRSAIVSCQDIGGFVAMPGALRKAGTLVMSKPIHAQQNVLAAHTVNASSGVGRRSRACGIERNLQPQGDQELADQTFNQH
jgi:hypothetical protein